MSMGTASDIENVLKDFDSISLDEVQKASLMRRKDSKFLFNVAQLPNLLSALKNDYRVLEIGNIRSHNYQTFYYDTEDRHMYHTHHRGMVNRHKVRFRKYGTSDLIFFEVKKKDSRGITMKNRMKIQGNQVSFQNGEAEFLAKFTPYGGSPIEPVLENSFNRITLVNQTQSERITLDYRLWFSNSVTDDNIELPGISIAEIKFENHLSSSRFHAALRNSHITPRRFSKYCIGMSLLNPDLKQNLFKQKLHRVRKINNAYLESIKN